jgi:hypothetical protein
MKLHWLVILCIALHGASYNMTCDYFDASECGSTNYASENYQSCVFDACGGDHVSIESSCINNPFLRLHSENGSLLMLNDDDGISRCPYLEFSLPSDYDCATYDARIGCYGNETDCAGQLSINFTGMVSVALIVD